MTQTDRNMLILGTGGVIMFNLNQRIMNFALGVALLLSLFQQSVLADEAENEAENGIQISSLDGVRIESSPAVRKINRWAPRRGQIIAIPRLSVSNDKVQSAILEAKCTIYSAMGSPRPGLCTIDENDKTETPTIVALKFPTGADKLEILKVLKESDCFAVVKFHESAE